MGTCFSPFSNICKIDHMNYYQCSRRAKLLLQRLQTHQWFLLTSTGTSGSSHVTVVSKRRWHLFSGWVHGCELTAEHLNLPPSLCRTRVAASGTIGGQVKFTPPIARGGIWPHSLGYQWYKGSLRHHCTGEEALLLGFTCVTTDPHTSLFHLVGLE